MFDAVIIGGGISGSAVARELSRYQGHFALLEKENDIGEGTTKANSAIIHAGFDAAEGTLMAKMNVRGNLLTEKLAKDLSFPFKRIGALVVCHEGDDREGLQKLLDRGIANGVKDLRIVERDELKELEPNIADDVACALYAPTSGIVCPFLMNIALAENAVANGVEVRLQEKVEKIEKTAEGYRLSTSKGVIETKAVINAAGLYADTLHNMVSKHKEEIIARRGEYYLFDKDMGGQAKHTIFSLPTKMGKGILITPTVHGNLIAGPTAEDIPDKEDTETTSEGLGKVRKDLSRNITGINTRSIITTFAGLRAHRPQHEFLLGEPDDAPFFFDCLGIESPGLSAAPAVGEYIASLVAERLQLTKKEDFIETRKAIPDPKEMTPEEYNELIKKEPAYGNIICRCERVSEGEILAAIHSPIPAMTTDAVKRRVRAGMGRCQSGFCLPKVLEILHREFPDKPLTDFCKSGQGSAYILGTVKEEQA